MRSNKVAADMMVILYDRRALGKKPYAHYHRFQPTSDGPSRELAVNATGLAERLLGETEASTPLLRVAS